MIRYSSGALRALGYLFRPFNDIDIYVEDTTCHNMYEVLINRMLGERAKVERIIQLGGREEVIAACKRDQYGSRRRLYIIDGDFNAFFGVKAPSLDHLYRLSVYCSENLIVSETAVYEVAYECLANVPKNELEDKIRLKPFWADLIVKLSPLLLMYGIAYALRSGIETVGWNITNALEQKGHSVELSEEKIRQRISEIRAGLQKGYQSDAVESATVATEDQIHGLGEGIIKFIPGKTYLLPLLYHYLRHKAGFKGTLDQLKVRLARNCELDVDSGLRAAVEAASRI